MKNRYDTKDERQLKVLGNELKSLLINRAPSGHWEDVRFAYTIAQEVLGFLPMDDGPNKMTDTAIKAGIPHVETMLLVLRILDALKAHE